MILHYSVPLYSYFVHLIFFNQKQIVLKLSENDMLNAKRFREN